VKFLRVGSTVINLEEVLEIGWGPEILGPGRDLTITYRNDRNELHFDGDDGLALIAWLERQVEAVPPVGPAAGVCHVDMDGYHTLLKAAAHLQREYTSLPRAGRAALPDSLLRTIINVCNAFAQVPATEAATS
jgi:hypothetical protein